MKQSINKTLLQAFANPTYQNIVALKISLGLKLEAEDIKQALRSSVPNPVKNWLTDIICCYIRFICNHQAAILNQLFLLKRQQEQYQAFLDELEQLKSQQKSVQLPLDLNTQMIEDLIIETRATPNNATCYQHLQKTKAEELLFWATLVTNPNQLAIITKAVHARYEWLSQGTEQIERIEAELLTHNLSPAAREAKEEKIQTYKDHIRLSATESLIKMLPEIQDNPDQAVHVAQTRVLNEEFYVKKLTDVSTDNEIGKNKQTLKKANICTYALINHSFDVTNKNGLPREKLNVMHNKQLLTNSKVSDQLNVGFNNALIENREPISEIASYQILINLIEKNYITEETLESAILQRIAEAAKHALLNKENWEECNNKIVAEYENLAKLVPQILTLEEILRAILNLPSLDIDKSSVLDCNDNLSIGL